MKKDHRKYGLAAIALSAALTTVVSIPPSALAIEASEAESPSALDPGFADVNPSEWYYDYVISCYNYGYMPGGYNLTAFEPSAVVTRADLASLFFGMSGAAFEAGNGTGDSAGYFDVGASRWYSCAVAWCKKNGIMSGVSDGKFSPNEPVTIEQASTFFKKYAETTSSFQPIDEATRDQVLASLPCQDEISSWAKESVAWCVHNGVLPSDESLHPNSILTKAELACCALKLQPKPSADISNKVLVPPTAIYKDQNSIEIVARALNARSIVWKRRAIDSQEWEILDITTPHFEVATNEFYQHDYMCTYTFKDGGTADASLDKSEPCPIVPTDSPITYSLTEGRLVISSTGNTAAPLEENFINCGPWINEASEIKSIEFRGNIQAPAHIVHIDGDMYSNLQSIDLTGLNIDKCTDLAGLLSGCKSLKTVIFGKRGGELGLDLGGILYNCAALERVVFTDSLKLGIGSSVASMFSFCPSLKSIEGLNYLDMGNIESLNGMFSGCSALTSLDLSKWNINKLVSLNETFNGCSSLTAVDLSGWNVKTLSSLNSTFSKCSSLEALNTSGWSTESLTSLQGTFSDCKSLKSLNLSNWAPKSLQALYFTFSGCTSLESLDLNNWKFQEGASLHSAFSGCSSLTNLGLANWNLAKFNDLSEAFRNCSKLKSIPVGNWNTERLRDARDCFRNCSSLEKLDLSSWTTPILENSESIFAGCRSLKTLDLSNWDTATAKESNSTAMSRMFEDCYSLTELKLGDAFKFASYPMGLRNVPKGMQWNASSTSASFSSTAELIDFQNTRSYPGAETYTLAKSDSTNPGGPTEGGSGGNAGEDESGQKGFQAIDNTDGRFSASISGTGASSITKVESDFLDEKDAEHKQLANKVKPGERPCGAYDIRITGAGKIVATFNIDESLNGEIVRIVQLKDNGDITSSPAAVIDGSAATIMNSSASIMIFAESEAAASFSDVPADAWYVTSGILDYSVSHNLLSGYDGGTFGPNDAFTRGQTVTVLWRIAGCPEVKSEAFDDVDYTQYYGKAVAWARKIGIAGGYEGTNNFGPNDPIGRAQLAVMLANYAKVIEGMNPSGDSSSMVGKEDVASVPEWALSSMNWAVKQGIMSGRVIEGKELLCPNDGAARCEAAKMLTVFHRDVIEH